MKETQQIDAQLWSYLDGDLAAADTNRVKQLLTTDPVWQERFKEVRELHQLLLQEAVVEQPSMRFTKNVMEQVAALQPLASTKTYINHRIIRGIAAFFLISIAGLLTYALLTQDGQSGSTTSLNLTPSITPIQLPKLQQTDFFTQYAGYIVMLAVTILGLVLVDSLLQQWRKTNAKHP